ncbi:MAG TPA: YhjD/YihY/BrkB family envelope integrity protein [Nannocystaceae bacterium]|nr:YhjD/YihY/BrkB family envelope integrity protein [Nannocystaceae bacterium]
MADDTAPQDESVEAPAAPAPTSPHPSASLSGFALRIQRWREVTSHLVPDAPEHRPTPGRRIWLLAMYVVRRWLVEDRCGPLAALLTMDTLLSTVPIIGVALLAVGLMDPLQGATVLHDFFRSLVPDTDRAEAMAAGALTLANNVTVGNLGRWGFAATLALAFVLFWTLERTFNRIWRVTRRRSIIVQFTMFYTLATLGPLLMLVSLAEPMLARFSALLGTPLITTSLGLVLLNRFLPFAAVRWRAALIGGVVSAILLEIAKVVFGYYAASFALQTYEGVYGQLAILPILVVWSYVSWMVVLLGAEITYVVHRHRAIALQGYVNRYVVEAHEVRRPSGRTAVRIMLAIADHHARREVGPSIDVLGERFRIGLDHVGEIVDALERRGWVIETTEPANMVIPARPLGQIRVIDVLELFDRDMAKGTREDRLHALLGELDRARAHIMAETTFAELVDEPRAPAVPAPR